MQVNFPSIKTLSNVSMDNAKELRKYLTVPYQELRQHPVAQARIRECYHPPKKYDVRLHVLNSIAETYGVEAIETTNGEYANYLNTGDMYAPTIIYWRGRYLVASVGDFIESLEKQHIHVI